MNGKENSMEMPLISVIVPVYRVEAYLDRCVRSIVEQTYRNLEILLIDDGSPDRSGEMCDAWAEKDSRIRVIHKENGGAGAARNTALDMARGELIGMVDSDDYIESHMYEHLYRLMEGETDIAECKVGITESDDCPMDDGSEFSVETYSAEEAMLLHIQDKIFCQTPPNKLYRRSVIEKIRFPVGTLIDDEFWTYRVIGNARRLAWSSCCMYAYRQQPGSAMHKPYSIRRLDGIEAKRQRLEYLQTRMPALVYDARVDLFFTCLFAMQGCLRSLPEAELERARQIIRSAVREVTPLGVSGKLSVKKNLLLLAAQMSFEGTSKGLNFLMDIHVLT